MKEDQLFDENALINESAGKVSPEGRFKTTYLLLIFLGVGLLIVVVMLFSEVGYRESFIYKVQQGEILSSDVAQITFKIYKAQTQESFDTRTPDDTVIIKNPTVIKEFMQLLERHTAKGALYNHPETYLYILSTISFSSESTPEHIEIHLCSKSCESNKRDGAILFAGSVGYNDSLNPFFDKLLQENK